MVMTSNLSADEIIMGGKSNIYFQGTTPGSLGALETYSYGKIMGSSDASADDRNGRLDFFTNNFTDKMGGAIYLSFSRMFYLR